MARVFEAIPQKNIPVETKYRKVGSFFPQPEACELINEMRKYEPRSMTGQPPVLWDKAEGIHVYDRWGNKWLDLSSCVVVANSGHTNPDVQKAVIDVASHGLLSTYCFPNEQRMKLVQRISELAPDPLNKVFLLTTGSEATECAIKLCRTYGLRKKGADKIKIVTFDNAFHGRTMGSQLAGGQPAGKAWIVNDDKDIIQAPFPNAFYYEWADESRADYSDDKCFAMFLKALEEKNVKPSEIAGIMAETFQGVWVQFMPKGFMQRLRNFCTEHDIILVMDEVQAAFGRTGKMFGFEHSGIVPDLVCCGKGITSSLPLSCVIGREDVMDLYGPNEMTSTHSGNPICSAAALANINYIVAYNLIDNSAKMGVLMDKQIRELQAKYADNIGWASTLGLTGCLVFVKPGTKEWDADIAFDIVLKCAQKGVLLFAPVGSGATIKIAPPLVITEEPLNEAFEVLDEAISEAIMEHCNCK